MPNNRSSGSIETEDERRKGGSFERHCEIFLWRKENIDWYSVEVVIAPVAYCQNSQFWRYPFPKNMLMPPWVIGGIFFFLTRYPVPALESDYIWICVA